MTSIFISILGWFWKNQPRKPSSIMSNDYAASNLQKIMFFICARNLYPKNTLIISLSHQGTKNPSFSALIETETPQFSPSLNPFVEDIAARDFRLPPFFSWSNLEPAYSSDSYHNPASNQNLKIMNKDPGGICLKRKKSEVENLVLLSL